MSVQLVPLSVDFERVVNKEVKDGTDEIDIQVFKRIKVFV